MSRGESPGAYQVARILGPMGPGPTRPANDDGPRDEGRTTGRSPSPPGVGPGSARSRVLVPLHRALLTLSLTDTVAVGVAIGAMVYLNQRLTPDHLPVLVASLAASVVVLFSLHGEEVARPWNVIAGQFLGALSGFLCATALGGHLALDAGCSVALSFVLMRLVDALHPPGAATALIVAIDPADHGAKFLFFPVLAGAVAITVFAWLVHLLDRHVPRWVARGSFPDDR